MQINLEQQEILDYWDAYIYEHSETQTEDVICLLSILGPEPRRILEVACGGGRICVPLALAGHNVTGFDVNAAMLRHAQQKAEVLPNLTCYQADALAQDWGTDYDVVVLAGNLLINIVCDGDYEEAQRQFLRKAQACLRPGGHLYLDFDCVSRSDTSANNSEWVCFEGTDDRGTYGKFIVMGGEYDHRSHKTRNNKRRFEITPKQGEPFNKIVSRDKHMPTLEQVVSWLYETGLTVERLYGSHQLHPFDADHRRAVIWAAKP